MIDSVDGKRRGEHRRGQTLRQVGSGPGSVLWQWLWSCHPAPHFSPRAGEFVTSFMRLFLRPRVGSSTRSRSRLYGHRRPRIPRPPRPLDSCARRTSAPPPTRCGRAFPNVFGTSPTLELVDRSVNAPYRAREDWIESDVCDLTMRSWRITERSFLYAREDRGPTLSSPRNIPIGIGPPTSSPSSTTTRPGSRRATIRNCSSTPQRAPCSPGIPASSPAHGPTKPKSQCLERISFNRTARTRSDRSR